MQHSDFEAEWHGYGCKIIKKKSREKGRVLE